MRSHEEEPFDESSESSSRPLDNSHTDEFGDMYRDLKFEEEPPEPSAVGPGDNTCALSFETAPFHNKVF
jgi:hypothetical protein